MSDTHEGPVEVSIVLPALDAVDGLGRQLDAVRAQGTDRTVEIIVADNGSTDGTIELVERVMAEDDRVRLVHVAVRGVSSARNAGSRAARGGKILLADGDDEVQPGWLDALADALDHADLVGGVLVGELPDGVERPLLRRRRVPDGLPVNMAFLPYTSGACMGYRRELFDALDGFDLEYANAGGDDVEFAWRAQLAGFEVRFVPEAVVRYGLRATVGEEFAQVMHYEMAKPMLHSAFAAHGARRDPWRQVVREWWRIVSRAYMPLRSPQDRATWLRWVAIRWGRLRGSVTHRHLYL